MAYAHLYVMLSLLSACEQNYLLQAGVIRLISNRKTYISCKL